MNKKSIIFICLLLFIGLAQANAKKQKDKKGTAYTKFFKKNNCKTEKGLITLHQSNGKVYFEFPNNLLGKEMMLGSQVEASSDASESFVGLQPHQPICIKFVKQDSTIQIRELNYSYVTNGEGIKNALTKNKLTPILASFKIKFSSDDSTSVVFDATNFFVDGNKRLDPFGVVGGFGARTTEFVQENSLLDNIHAFEDNITITSCMSYKLTTSFMGFSVATNKPYSSLIKRSLILLPEKKMKPRLSDPRIGVFYNIHTKLSSDDNGSKNVVYTNRWDLQPKDLDAFNRGELVEPVKPIVFYIDDKFPNKWYPYIKKGVEMWNKAFEGAGFKNVIITHKYPKNDSNFDPNSLRYNCIKYAPVLTQNSMGPSWIDPRTGEILNASVYLYHGISDLLNSWMFIQTAAADPRTRTTNMPDHLMGDAIKYIATHEVGHCLGLMHNMGASAAFPVDSLRSPSFTQKYGTTASIMDYARFNYVAQPGDFEKGVKMTPPDLGVYDYYVIKWLYKPILNMETPEQEVPILDKWISDKIKDPMYVYGKQQLYTRFDPRSQTEDLGDDPVKATRYAIKNLKYICEHMQEWLKDEDEDLSKRSELSFAIINIQFYRFYCHVLTNVGGVNLYEKYEGDPFPAYKALSKKVQKESILFILDILENSQWMNTPSMVDNLGIMHGDASFFLRKALFPHMFNRVMQIDFSEAKSYEDTYTQAEAIDDVFNYLWSATLKGQKISEARFDMQKSFVELLILNSKVVIKKSKKPLAGISVFGANAELMKIQDLVAREDAIMGLTNNEQVDGYEFLKKPNYLKRDTREVYFKCLMRNKEILKRCVRERSGDFKNEYKYLLAKINNALNKN